MKMERNIKIDNIFLRMKIDSRNEHLINEKRVSTVYISFSPS